MESEDTSSSDTKPSHIDRLLGPVSRLLRLKRADSPHSEKGPKDLPVLTVDHDARAENKERRRDVNSLPPWIHSLRQGENIDEVDAHNPLLSPPPRIKPPEHNHMPVDPKSQPQMKAGRGRIWNHARTKDAVTMPYHSPDGHSRWQAFAQSSMYPPEHDEEGELVGDDWLEKNIPDLDTPWRSATMSDEDADKRYWLFSPTKRVATYNRFQRALMRNAFVPLIVRLIVLAFSIAALAIGVQIYRQSDSLNDSRQLQSGTTVAPSADNDSYICKQQTSTYMAFIVNAIAPVYTFYITLDEYRSAPLGLRSSRSKLRLLFFDLVFIIFAAANLSLAFNTLTDEQWSCFTGNPNDANDNNAEAARTTCVYSEQLCHRQRGLVSVLLIAEIAWVLTFSISILRVVERVSR